MSVIIGGIYEHYKGNKYKIMGVARHSETLEKLVVYQALYGNNELWVRPYEMFCEKIEFDEKIIERFKYIEEYTSPTRIMFDLPTDLKISLFENNIDIEQELTSEFDNIGIEYIQFPNKNEKTKDASLVILAVGVSVSAVIICVTKLIRAINERPRLVKIIEQDNEENTIKENTILLEPNKSDQKMELDLEIGTKNIKFKIIDDNK